MYQKMLAACESGNLFEVIKLYVSGCSISEQALLTACEMGHIHVAKWICGKGIKSSDAFVSSCKMGQLEMAKWLLDENSNIDQAFIKSCESGQLEIAQWLYELYRKGLPPRWLKRLDNGTLKASYVNCQLDIPDSERLSMFYCENEVDPQDIGDIVFVNWLTKLDQAFRYSHNHHNILKWLHSLNVGINLDRAFEICCETGNLSTARLLNDMGIDNIDDEHFIQCCKKGHWELAKWIYEQDVELSDRAFIQCCKGGNLEIAKMLCPKVDIHAKNDSAFVYACGSNFELAKWLNSLGVDTNAQWGAGFEESCANGKLEIAKWLYDTGISTRIDSDIFTKICVEGYLDVAMWLYDIGIDICIDIGGIEAICANGHLVMIAWLHEICVDLQNEINESFVVSCSKGHCEQAEWLSILGIEIALPDSLFETVCKNGHTKVAQLLFSINEKFRTQFAPMLLIAREKGYVELAEWLSSYDVQPKKYNKEFVDACNCGDLDAAEMFFGKIDRHHLEQAQLVCCKEGQLEIVKWLHNKNVMFRKYHFKKCCKYGHIELAKWFIGIGTSCFKSSCRYGQLELAKILCVPSELDSALYEACVRGHFDLVVWLCSKGARDLTTYRTFEVVCRYGYLNMAKFLFEVYGTDSIDSLEAAFNASCRYGQVEVAKWLLFLGAKPEWYLPNAFARVCARGQLDLAKKIYDRDFDNMELAFYDDCYVEIFRLLNDQIEDISPAFLSSCSKGHTEIAKWIDSLDKVDNVDKVDYDRAFQLCCQNGHMDTAIWLQSLGANTAKALDSCCAGGHLELAKWVYTLGYADLHDSFVSACAMGHLDVAQWLYELNPDVMFQSEIAFKKSHDNNHFSIAKWINKMKPVTMQNLLHLHLESA